MASGVLEVVLVDSEGIRERNFLNCVTCFHPWAVKKPYVCIQYGDQERISSVASGQGKKSIWNQKFEFEVDYQGEEENHSLNKLVFRVMDKHKLSDDNYVGEASVYVKEVVSLGMEKGKEVLETRKYRVVRPDKSYTGDISVAVAFKKKDAADEDVGGWKESRCNPSE